MAKKQSKQKRRMPEAAESPKSTRDSAKKSESHETVGEFFASKGVRETIESIAIAFILAFLFRTFEAEAFVIPTGSMAETLRGRHLDVTCPKCGFQHLAGASEDRVLEDGAVVASTCPMCRNLNRFEPFSPEEPYFTGDRIIVSKFVYDVEDPRRWDVVVFKFPFNAKDNYIKRLVGKPNETLKISGGDVWVRPLDSDDDVPFIIARKPPAKLNAMMQMVHDTDYTPQALVDAGWPTRWQVDADAGGSWEDPKPQTVNERGAELARYTYKVKESSAQRPAWLRYHHYIPTQADWDAIESSGEVQPPPAKLITDFYGYNAFINASPYEDWQTKDFPDPNEALGMHWVGDLALECDVEITGEEGELLLDLVEGGVHYQCAINVADGTATLSIVDIDGNAKEFSDDAGKNATETVTGKTSVGPGKHRLRLANADNEITLWVDGDVIKFDGPTTYLAPAQRIPNWNDTDAGDLAPAGIGSAGAEFTVSRMQVFRDVYYVAVDEPRMQMMDYDLRNAGVRGLSIYDVNDILQNPSAWRVSRPDAFEGLFNSRRSVRFDLAEDQFFTMGDNSPQSKDARIWDPLEHFVHRDYLIGKALFIYWPHATGPLWLPNPWDAKRGQWTFPLVPDFSRMGFVR